MPFWCYNITSYNKKEGERRKFLVRGKEDNVPPIIQLVSLYRFPYHQIQGREYYLLQHLIPPFPQHVGYVP